MCQRHHVTTRRREGPRSRVRLGGRGRLNKVGTTAWSLVVGWKNYQGHTPRYDGTLTLHHALDADGCDDLMVEHASNNGRDNGGRTRELGGIVENEEHDTTALHRRH